MRSPGYRIVVVSVVVVALIVGGVTIAVAGSGSTTAPITKAQAAAYAHTVNLRVSDLPGFKLALAGESEHGDAPSGPLPRPVEECDGGPVVNGASRGVASPLFQKESVPIQTILSIVYPMRDRSIASAYIAAADGGRGLGCLQREEVRKRAASGLHGNTEVVALAPPLAGAPVSGVRIWRCLPGSQPCRNRDDRSFTDRLWFAAGPYVVTIFYIAPAQNEAKGPEPLALPIERHLITLLHTRAQAHKL
jgi:hypothetical protein